MADNPGQDLAKSMKDAPSRVADTLTLGPERRALSNWAGGEMQKAKTWLTTPIGGSSPSKAPEPPAPTGPKAAHPNAYKHGGVVKKTGVALVHEGETIIPKHDDDDKQEYSGHHVSLYRAMHHLRKGGLHRALDIPEGESIPQDKLEAAKHSSNPHVAHMANFASTMEGFHH